MSHLSIASSTVERLFILLYNIHFVSCEYIKLIKKSIRGSCPFFKILAHNNKILYNINNTYLKSPLLDFKLEENESKLKSNLNPSNPMNKKNDIRSESKSNKKNIRRKSLEQIKKE